MIPTNPQHRRILRTGRLLAAAVALALPALAHAQGQVQTGRANDASNRVGSNGYNDPGTSYNRYSNVIINNGNQVVTGNVTMGREFRGQLNYTSPYSLRTPTAGLTSDNFIKNSAGVPQPHAAPPPPNQAVPFYGTSQTAAPPPGFQLNPTRGGFVPAPAPSPGPRGFEDQRLGVVDLNQPVSPSVGSSTMMTRGSLTPNAEGPGGIITGSSLYGVREWNPQNPADRLFLESMMRGQNNAFERLRLDPREIQRMREEVEKTLGPSNQEQDQTQRPGARGVSDSFTLNPLGTRSFDAPANAALNNKPINDQVQTGQLTPSGVDTGEGHRRRFLDQAQRTSTQYAELNSRLEQYYADRRKTDADFAREFNAELRARQQAEKAKGGDQGKKLPGVNEPGAGVPQPAPQDPNAARAPVNKPAPLKIPTLSQGIKAEGLANLMKKAEGLMKEGRFVSALDQYEAAEAVTPNNPLIWMGKANAELGAGLFARADAHLRQAYTADKALLMGQYDLRNMIGEQRLEKIIADLKELASKDESKAMPVWLLAYISYNSGNERMALGFLDLAEKRAGGQDKDPFFKTVRDHWALPEAQPQPQNQNK